MRRSTKKTKVAKSRTSIDNENENMKVVKNFDATNIVATNLFDTDSVTFHPSHKVFTIKSLIAF